MTRLLAALLVLLLGSFASGVTITRVSANMLFYDTAQSTIFANGNYAAYEIALSAGEADQPDVWVTLGGFTGTNMGIAASETATDATRTTALAHVGALTSAAPKKTVFFYLTVNSTATGTTNHTVRVFGNAARTNQLLSQTYSLTTTSIISAQANKVVCAGPLPLVYDSRGNCTGTTAVAQVGGTIVLRAVGDTGTIGSLANLYFRPATNAAWPANKFQLIGSTVTLSGGNSGTYTNTLSIPITSTTTTRYVADYTFRVMGSTDSTTAVSPVSDIPSGTQVKYSDLSGGSLIPIPKASNHLSITKTANVTTLENAGQVTYTVRLTNSGTQTISTDLFTDTLPGGVTYAPGSSTYGGAAIGNPAVTTNASGQNVLTWSGFFSVPAGASRDLVYRVDFPAAGNNYTNTVNATVGNETIGPATVTVTEHSADLSLAKVHAGSAFTPGQAAAYTLTVTNSASSFSRAAGPLTVTDTLPASLTFVSGGGNGWSCSVSGQNVTCTNPGPLAVSASTNFTLNVNVASGVTGSISNTATVTSGTLDPSTANNTSTDTVSVANFSLTNTHSPDPFVRGGTGTITLTLANYGTSALTGTKTVQDTIPAGLTITSVSAPGWTCTRTGQQVSCSRSDDLAAGTPYPAITVNVNVTQASASSLSNTATVTTASGTGSAPDVIPVTSRADLGVSITNGLTSVRTGDQVTYTVTVTNAGPSDDPAATLNVNVPPSLGGVTWTCSTAGGGSCPASGTGAPSVGLNLPVGASATLQLSGTVTGTTSGTLSTTATVTASVTDPAGANNTATDTDTLTGPADLQLVKAIASPTPIPAAATVGQGFVFELILTNNGPNTATNVTVSDKLPAALAYDAATTVIPAGTTYDPASGAWVVPSLASGASVTLRLGATAQATTFSNTGTITAADQADPTPGNNTGTASVPVSGGTVTGTVFADLNHDGTYQATESALSGVAVTLHRPDGSTVTAHTATDAQGRVTYAFPNTAAGTYTVTVATVSGYVATTATSVTVTLTTVRPSAGVNFGQYHGARATGTVFRDTGSASGAAADANNALQDAGERSLSGITVRILGSDGVTALAVTSTNGAGQYTLYVPAGLASATVHVVMPEGFTRTGTNVNGSGARPASYATDPQATRHVLTPEGGSVLDGRDVAGLNFGVAPPLNLQRDAAGFTSAPGSVLYLHTLTPGTPGHISMSVSGALTYRVFLDANGNGALDATDPPVTALAPLAVDAAWPRDASGALTPRTVIVQVLTPAGVPNGTTDIARVTATQAFANNSSVQRVVGVTDTTTVWHAAFGQLQLTKRVRNCGSGDANCVGPFSTSTISGRTGDVLEYCIAYANLGTGSVSAAVITDPIPFFTQVLLNVGDYGNGAVSLNGSFHTATDDGDAGTLNATQLTVNVGTVAPGGAGSACYRARIR